MGQRVGSFADDGRRDDGLVLGVRLFGEQRARQVELAARPACIGAERADVGERCRDFLRLSASPNAGMRRSKPRIGPPRCAIAYQSRIGFARSEVAIGEVGKRHVEAELGRRRPPRPSPPWHAAQAAV